MRYFVEQISLCEIGLKNTNLPGSQKSMPYSNFVILIPKKTSLAHRASDGQNPLARSQTPVAQDYRTRICMT